MTAAVTLAQLASSGALSADTSGNVGIGTTTPSFKLDIKSTVVGGSFFAPVVTNTDTTAGARAGLVAINGSVSTVLGANSNSGVGEVGTFTNNPLVFYTNTTERMRLDSSGNLSVGGTSYSDQINSQNGSNSKWTISANATAASGIVYGYISRFANQSPNNGNSIFSYYVDSTAVRCIVYSNGGIANYQANNSNLSDQREKTNFAPAGNYLSKICAIPVQTFNYIDQNLEEDDGLTLGVIAQDVQAVAPELVTESNWGTEEEPRMRLSIYQTDLQYALMKSIQELKAELDVCKAEIAALKGV